MCEPREEKSVAKHRILFAFDFDHTLVDENTDKYILKLLPEQEKLEERNIIYKDDNWIEYMGEIFKYLHSLGKSKNDILQCMAEIPFTEGMKELLDFKRENFDIDYIIISDSNSVFINHILDVANLSNSILRIFTNPAEFDSDGCLTVRGYHMQESCTLSSINLCKGDILKKFLQERRASSIEYASVFYVGDGYNDLCPGLVLCEKDFLLPRCGYKLQSTIEKIEEINKPVKRSDMLAKVVTWSTGHDILEHLDNWIREVVAKKNSHL